MEVKYCINLMTRLLKEHVRKINRPHKQSDKLESFSDQSEQLLKFRSRYKNEVHNHLLE